MVWLRDSINCDHIMTNQLVFLDQLNSIEADLSFRFPGHNWSNVRIETKAVSVGGANGQAPANTPNILFNQSFGGQLWNVSGPVKFITMLANFVHLFDQSRRTGSE